MIALSAFIILIEFVGLDDIYQSCGVCRGSGVSTLLESFGPSLVVGDFQIEEPLVSVAQQEARMILVGVLRIAINAEAVVLLVVILVHASPRPSTSALDAEMVVSLSGQVASPRSALEQSLCQSDTCRYMVFLHLLDGHILVLVDVIEVSLVLSVLSHCRQCEHR